MIAAFACVNWFHEAIYSFYYLKPGFIVFRSFAILTLHSYCNKNMRLCLFKDSNARNTKRVEILIEQFCFLNYLDVVIRKK